MKRHWASHCIWLITTTMILLAFLSSCNLPISEGSTLARPGVVEKAQLVLTVTSRKPLTQGQQIEMVVIDEVTGVPFQKERLPLSQTKDGSYGIVYPTPVGTVVTYYFQKLAADGSFFPEVRADGMEINFRRLYVDQPGMVKETIAGWADDLPTGQQSGEVSGVILSREMGEPLADILVSAGGIETITDINGKFTLYPLAEGSHSLTAISMSGTYLPIQHDFQASPGKVTVAELEMIPSLWREVTFKVKTPAGTIEGAPIRLAGNLEQLGNTFHDLGSGISGDAARMPALTPLSDGWYSLQMVLPAGIDIRYKYTLGDGFWNAEHGLDQQFVTHQLILPLDGGSMVVEDRVATWRTSNTETIWFKAEVPLDTPPGETIGVQFSIAEWLPALPMMPIGENTWVFPLISPHNFSGEIPYRYCRQTPCVGLGQSGIESPAITRQIPTNFSETHVNSEPVEDWAFLSPDAANIYEFADLTPRDANFVYGVALSPFSQHTVVTDLPGDHIILSPAWVPNPANHPRMLAPSIADTMRAETIHGMVRAAHDQGKTVSLYPQVIFTHGADKWWQSQPTDEETFWLQFLTEHRNFVYQYANLAALAGADEIILGGDWLLPALPEDGHFEIYSQPGNIEMIWADTLIGVRERFQGKISFVVSLELAGNPPEFLSQVDTIYLAWDLPLEKISSDAMGSALDEHAQTLASEVHKPVVILAAIPSVQGYELDCIPSPNAAGDCLDTSNLKIGPTLENPAASDLEMQADYYYALLTAVSERDWVAGVVTQGYYPDLALNDTSASIHGKPAEQIFNSWLALISRE